MSASTFRFKITILCSILALFVLTASVIPGLGKVVAQYDIRGVPLLPGETISGTGSFVGDVNIYSGYGRYEIPLYTLVGRGDVSFPLSLYYSTNVRSMEINFKI